MDTVGTDAAAASINERRFAQSTSPKVSVKSQDSLFLITYSNMQQTVVQASLADRYPSLKKLNILLYIDIPTIDYYNDEMTHNKLSRLNKRFKLHRLRNSIAQSFSSTSTAEDNDKFWEELKSLISSRSTPESKFDLNVLVSSSGSLRYVETIRFLVEKLFNSFRDLYVQKKLNLCFQINVSPTSLKWFSTFLNAELLNLKIINWQNIGSFTKTIQNSKSLPFKEYYTKLNEKFTSSNQSNGSMQDQTVLDSIVIVTNSTGVKALLTLLSDHPLTSLISQESIKALHEYSDAVNEDKGDDQSNTSLKRNSSSLLNFQNSVLTSNKDKSVRIRSLSINRKSNRAHMFKTNESITTIPSTSINNLIGQESNLRKQPSGTALHLQSHLHPHSRSQSYSSSNMSRSPSPFPYGKTPSNDELVYDELNNQINEVQDRAKNEEIVLYNNNNYDDYRKERGEQEQDKTSYADEYGFNYDDEEGGNEDNYDDDEDDDDDDDDDDESDDEGLSFYAPSILSRSGSSTDVLSSGIDSMAKNSKETRGRFRSLSLMDPALQKPFNQKFPNSQQPDSAGASSPKRSNSSNHFTNVYVHDGDFDGTDTINNKKNLSSATLIKRKSLMNRNLAPSISNGLIPPEFISRISTPSTSASSSNSSLNDMSTVSNAFSKLLNDTSKKQKFLNSPIPQHTQQAPPLLMRNNSNSNLLFEKNLINKSFEELRRQPSVNLFSTLMNGNMEKNGLALNFKSRTPTDALMANSIKNSNNSSHRLLNLEEEDQIMSGSIPKEREDDNDSTNSTIVPNHPDNDNYNDNDNDNNTGISSNNFNLNLYDDNDGAGFTDVTTEGVKYSNSNSTVTKPVYKKAVTLDLYGEDDMDNMGGWVLGGNAR
ncbi:BAQ_1a_G0010560.mRNA.1.CDS.1 [Saccharomyces cerevisiae]|nr:BAQ_1a_G0010560.mRNA.1.CDS.1 [Saccharomyces cerevisiae]CAI4515445.1 BAM_G0019570.mRNA.1.CDS.1 [Saccharomyces cerevisiae]CAI7074861.1 BAQ_1a_G0010560.mRNA.1.CDS.1 [Saccharomyces cerevisiae]CAI7134039.1 BAM_G0019570.mRNA.1.CDS.1 [Saccharomyces cerevisiae]